MVPWRQSKCIHVRGPPAPYRGWIICVCYSLSSASPLRRRLASWDRPLIRGHLMFSLWPALFCARLSLYAADMGSYPSCHLSLSLLIPFANPLTGDAHIMQPVWPSHGTAAKYNSLTLNFPFLFSLLVLYT
jgi:hypothetical protein